MTDQVPVLPAQGYSGERVGVEGREVSRRIGRIEIYEHPAEALSVWTELEAIAPASAYQTHKWLVPWIETVGRSSGVCPMIVVARGINDLPIALFPFGIVQKGSVRVVHFLGGSASNSPLGLPRPGKKLDGFDIFSLSRAPPRKARLRPDAFVLLNQPRNWEGVEDPLTLLRHQPSPR